MRRLVLIALGLFWVAVIAIVGSARIPSAPPKKASPSALAGRRELTRKEVAAHASVTDCWMIIDRTVYDVTSYLPMHPAPPAVLSPWCGQDATQAYRQKGGRGRSHSDVADELLATFSIGGIRE